MKFAKYKPEPIENESSFSNSWDFVSATKLTEVVEENNIDKEKQVGKSV